MEKRKRRTKAEILAAKSEGLGDTVEKVLEATGVSKVAKWLLGEDCGCDERKAKLNALFPYRKPECLLKDEHEYLTQWFTEKRYSMKPTEQKELLRIYNRVFKVNMQPTSCGSCLRDVMNKLEILYNSYKEEDANS
jgi:hypothetical protein